MDFLTMSDMPARKSTLLTFRILINLKWDLLPNLRALLLIVGDSMRREGPKMRNEDLSRQEDHYPEPSRGSEHVGAIMFDKRPAQSSRVLAKSSTLLLGSLFLWWLS